MKPQLVVSLVIGSIVIVGSIAFSRSHIDFSRFASLGYTGIFFLAFLGSATLFVPIPNIAIVFASGVFLNPVYVAIVAGFGAALGELIGYIIGRGGKVIRPESHWYMRAENWFQRYGGMTIFLLALIPNPIFDLVGLIAGISHYSVIKFFGFTLAGKIIRSFLLAYVGSLAT